MRSSSGCIQGRRPASKPGPPSHGFGPDARVFIGGHILQILNNHGSLLLVGDSKCHVVVWHEPIRVRQPFVERAAIPTPEFRSDSQYGNVATLAAGRPNTPQRRGPIFSFPIPQTTLYRFQVSYCGVAGREAYTPAPELTGWPPIDPLTGWDNPSINPNPRIASTFCHAFSNAWM